MSLDPHFVPDLAAAVPAATYDGVAAGALAIRIGVPRIVLLESVGSTLDVAHALGREGTPAGTLLLADRQTAGRGRQGRTWHSEPGRGIWLTLVEQPTDTEALDVLSLRLGLAAASALAPYSSAPVRLKWPNDVLVGGQKMAGILVEARWRQARVDWIAIGFGLNVRPPSAVPEAAALAPGASRVAVLEALVPALRRAVRAQGPLSDGELAAYAALDAMRGRRCAEPLVGVVVGIDHRGGLLVDTAEGRRTARSGSLVFEPTTAEARGAARNDERPRSVADDASRENHRSYELPDARSRE